MLLILHKFFYKYKIYMDYKEKYLKYKNKYLKLKNQNGGTMTEQEKMDLKIDMCVSYVTEVIGSMQLVLDSIKKYKSEIQKWTTNNSNPKLSYIAQAILNNFANIETLKIINIGTKSHRAVYADLFYFEGIDPAGNYIVKIPQRGKSIYKISKTLNYGSLQFAKNSLVNLEADEGVHWIYIDNDARIHNPYNYNMQKDHSHQFCQTHSLLMALIPDFRTECKSLYDPTKDEEENSRLGRLCAYVSIVELLEIILYLVIRDSFDEKKTKKKGKQNSKIILKNSLHEDIIETIRGINLTINTDSYSPEIDAFVNDYMDNYLKLPVYRGYTNAETAAYGISQNILETLKTARALEIVPDFE